MRLLKRVAWVMVALVMFVAVTALTIEAWAKANHKTVSMGMYDAPPGQP